MTSFFIWHCLLVRSSVNLVDFFASPRCFAVCFFAIQHSNCRLNSQKTSKNSLISIDYVFFARLNAIEADTKIERERETKSIAVRWCVSDFTRLMQWQIKWPNWAPGHTTNTLTLGATPKKIADKKYILISLMTSICCFWYRARVCVSVRWKKRLNIKRRREKEEATRSKHTWIHTPLR